MRIVVFVMILLLVILHQDNWNWDDSTLIGGVVPIGLAWHAGISVAAGITWYLATLFCWPKTIESHSIEKEPQA